MTVGNLSNDECGEGSENVVKKKWICILSNFIASISGPPSTCQMWPISRRVDFLRTLSTLKKRMENSSSYVHVLHKVDVSWDDSCTCICRAVRLSVVRTWIIETVLTCCDVCVCFFFGVMIIVTGWKWVHPGHFRRRTQAHQYWYGADNVTISFVSWWTNYRTGRFYSCICGWAFAGVGEDTPHPAL